MQSYGRTSLGAQEIKNKSGRLTQSERLVLILLGDCTTAEELYKKLPSLRPERIDAATAHLVELNLAFVIGDTEHDDEPGQFSSQTVMDFLQQSEEDPSTVMLGKSMVDELEEDEAVFDTPAQPRPRAESRPDIPTLTQATQVMEMPTTIAPVPVAIYGRTSLGAKEIQSKSGRLTQSERLVLILLGDGITMDELCKKLPSLTLDRIRAAMRRLIELGLAFDTDPSSDGGGEPISTQAVIAFLQQSEADPSTVMAQNQGMLLTADTEAPPTTEVPSPSPRLGTQRYGPPPARATSSSTPNAARSTVDKHRKERVPLSKVFPGGEASVYVEKDVEELQRQAELAIARLAASDSSMRRHRTPTARGGGAQESSMAWGAMALMAILFVIVIMVLVAAYLA